jgi:hypothetical protein
LVTLDVTQGTFNSAWPVNIGWDGDFNGDWYSDGTAARWWNPTWGGTGPLPTTSGFFKFMDVHPAPGSTMTFTADIDPAFTAVDSRATLVLYFYACDGSTISIATSTPLFKGTQTRVGIYDQAIPAGTARIGIAPMAYFGATETNTVNFKTLSVDYAPGITLASVATITEDFSSFGPSAYGNNQPTGWIDSGGNWLVDPSNKWATWWNPTFGANGTTLPQTAILSKDFPLTTQSGDLVDGTLFAAANFTDPGSSIGFRVTFNDAASTQLASGTITGPNYGTLHLSRAAAPAGATSVHVEIVLVAGAAETKSLYVDNLLITQWRPQ